jgi:hypothetical protein
VEWGLNARGTWELSGGQYLSFSRDFALGWGGKRIFGARLSRKQNEVKVVDGWVMVGGVLWMWCVEVVGGEGGWWVG